MKTHYPPDARGWPSRTYCGRRPVGGTPLLVAEGETPTCEACLIKASKRPWRPAPPPTPPPPECTSAPQTAPIGSLYPAKEKGPA